MSHKIILDTDPGIDDAMAILFAEAHPAIDLIAITTVFGNATIDNGTRNALWLKQKYGMKADVAQGAAAPLLRDPVGPTTVVHGPSGFGDVEAGEVNLAPDARPAWQYIVDAVKAAPGEITLVTIGPLTNLALAQSRRRKTLPPHMGTGLHQTGRRAPRRSLRPRPAQHPAPQLRTR